MKSNQKLSVLCAALGFVGFLCQGNVKTLQMNGITLADIEAFTDSESDSETSGGSTTPPDSWNYVPNRYIKSSVKTLKLVCTTEGYLTVDGKTISGDYKKDVTYSVVVEIKNCDGKQDGAWCDQRQVGSRVISASDPELD